MGNDPGSPQAAGAEGGGLAALCFPISLGFYLSPDPPGFKPAIGLKCGIQVHKYGIHV